MSRIKKSLQSLSKIQILGIGLLLIILSGFGTAAYINATSLSGLLTQMECRCQEISQANNSSGITFTDLTEDIDCNSRVSSKSVFHLGLVEVSKHCSSTQVYVCEEGEKVDEYFRDNGCNYEITTVLS